jgi:RNA polymerase sigma-70 factor, ECF subfamily
MNGDTSEITGILREWSKGHTDAEERLLPYVYDELRRQARSLMSRERGDHTLQPTALVNEAFLRIPDRGVEWKDRRHFYGVVSRLMRQVLIDHARRHGAAKRGSGTIHFSVNDIDVPAEDRAAAFIALNDALDRLEKLDDQQARIVEMRFFAGMSNREIADALGVSERTVCRDWETARLWLFRELNSH